MSGRIEIQFVPGEGAMIRMLGLIERRGFAIRAMTMAEASGAASVAMDVEPSDTTRCLDVLARQLGRLVDVNSVSIEARDPGMPE